MIYGIISSDLAVHVWAREREISQIDPKDNNIVTFLSQHPFDYLFSIVNAHILPKRIVELPRRVPSTFMMLHSQDTRGAMQRPGSLWMVKDLWLARSPDQNIGDFTKEELDDLVSYAFDRYFGTPGACLRMINHLKAIDADEVACLIDIGVDFDSVLSSLHNLDTVSRLSNKT